MNGAMAFPRYASHSLLLQRHTYVPWPLNVMSAEAIPKSKIVHAWWYTSWTLSDSDLHTRSDAIDARDCESEKCVVWCMLTVFFSFQRDGIAFAALSQVWHASAELHPIGR
jgi:hypothetical protein